MTKKATLIKTTNSVETKKTPNAELKRVTKTVTEEEKEEQRKAVQAQLKRTTKTISNDEDSGSGSSNTNSNGMGYNEEKEEIFKKDYFLKELYYQPSLHISRFDVLDVIDALVDSNNTSTKQNEKLIDLNKKKKNILKTKLKTVDQSE